MTGIFGIIRLMLGGFLLGARIWTDEKLRADGRREVMLSDAAKTIAVLRRYNEIDEEVSGVTTDDIFKRLLERANKGNSNSPRAD